ncbi:hypothetical protein R9C00_20930 [Flammeovirgaceae bacterium SG7u.111]|nr:hypothetical protein [Flammeovirgaceae bacterium SG7u.132]WPO34166.1 hypothetical protein R9C00_20930 [Flammeovirgaceae bacterium SG7u.111]
MFTQFNHLPPHSKIWVYQADRVLSKDEVSQIEDVLIRFVGSWQAHGADLVSSFKVLYNRFIVIGVDTEVNLATGCSIDKSVAQIKELGSALAINFFDRTQIAFLEEGSQVFTSSLSTIKSDIESGKVKASTLTFNSLVETKEKFDAEWLVTAADSWLKRYFNTAAV